jgi:hypothetical protein
VALTSDLPESDLLDLRAQFDGVNPNASVVIDVGVVQALVEMALRLLELES